MGLLVAASGGDGTGTGEGGNLIHLEGHSFVMSAAGVTFEPTYVTNVDVNLAGNTDAITDQCGRTNVQRNGHTNWNISAEGIVIQRNLSELQLIGEINEDIQVEADVLGDRSGLYTVEDLTISHTDELNTVKIPADTGPLDVPAYQWQVQLKDPEAPEE